MGYYAILGLIFPCDMCVGLSIISISIFLRGGDCEAYRGGFFPMQNVPRTGIK